MKRMMSVGAVFVILLLCGGPVAAQGPEEEKADCVRKCTPEGIWYGGAELDEDGLYFKWILNITRKHHGSGYLATGHAGWGVGVPVVTPVNGESRRIGRNRYEIFAIGYRNTDPAYPPITPPTITAVHAIMTLVDCNTIHIEYDFQGVYEWGMEPFVDEPIMDFGFWAEDYTRIAMPAWPPDW
jgi:hypothetical protein